MSGNGNLATRHLVFARGGQLYAVRFDASSLATSGTPGAVLQGASMNSEFGFVQAAIASDAPWCTGPPNRHPTTDWCG